VFVQAEASDTSIASSTNLAALRGFGVIIWAVPERNTVKAAKMMVTLWCHFAVSDALTSNHSATRHCHG